MDALEGLNPAQKEAVLATTGPVIIVAGAGTGKTRVLISRIRHLIETEGVPTRSVLAITFTNKAAGEMKERLASRYHKPFIGTFHGFGLSLLRDNSEALGIPRRFSIFDRDDSLALIKRIQKDLGLDPKALTPSSVLSRISKSKGEAVDLRSFRERASGERNRPMIATIWERYAEAMHKEKAFDFDDLLLSALDALRTHPEILAAYRERFTHILIDEYQDTNTVQYELARLIAEPRGNICVVGDHDQCIYTWRSADMRNLEKFEQDFKGARVILLEENYRSTKTILGAANSVINRNAVRKAKTLYTENADGAPIELIVGSNEMEEARRIAERTRTLLDGGVPASEIAVLFRAHFQSRALEEAFLREGLPYQMVGTRFFERKEVKDVMSYIQAALNPNNTVSFSRIINVPTRGIGKVTLLRVLSGKEHELTPAQMKRVSEFKNILERIRTAAKTLSPSELIKVVMRESGIEQDLSSDDDGERLLNLKELASLATRYDVLPAEERLDAFLDAVSLVSDQDSLSEPEDSVKLMTIHAAKGLEFDHVFITGLEEGLFPSERSEMRATPEEREEERRLFYVALTRAKKQAHLSYASVRTVFGSTNINMPSRFITEIDDAFLEKTAQSGSDGSARELLTINWNDL